MRLNYETYKRIISDYVEPDVDLACLPPLLLKAARDQRNARQHFAENIVPLLTKNREEMESMLGQFCALIYEDDSIPEKQKDALWALAYNRPLPEFLAETFLYAVRRDALPEKYKAAPVQNSNIVTFQRQRGDAQNRNQKVHGGEADNDSIFSVMTSFINQNKRAIFLAALPFILVGVAAVWLGAHFQIDLIMEIGYIIAGIGAFALLSTQLPHKRRFVFVTFLVIIIGVAFILLGNRNGSTLHFLSGITITVFGGIIPFLCLFFAIAKRWPRVIDIIEWIAPKLRLFMIVGFVLSIAAFFLIPHFLGWSFFGNSIENIEINNAYYDQALTEWARKNYDAAEENFLKAEAEIADVSGRDGKLQYAQLLC